MFADEGCNQLDFDSFCTVVHQLFLLHIRFGGDPRHPTALRLHRVVSDRLSELRRSSTGRGERQSHVARGGYACCPKGPGAWYAKGPSTAPQVALGVMKSKKFGAKQLNQDPWSNATPNRPLQLQCTSTPNGPPNGHCCFVGKRPKKKKKQKGGSLRSRSM